MDLLRPLPALKRILLGFSLVLVIAGLVLGLPSKAAASDIISPQVQAELPDPQAVFRHAYDKRYTWDPDFPGYWVEVSVRYNQDIYHGLAKIKPDFGVEVVNMNSLTDAHNQEVSELVKNELRMEVIHRKSVPFDQLHGQSQFTLEGQDQAGAWQIRERGDNLNSYYKVQNQKITQVNRVLGETAVTVDTLGFERPPEGYIPAHFQTVFRDAQTGEVLGTEEVRDSHTKVGPYYLLTNRSIRRLAANQENLDRGDDILIRFDHPSPI